MIHGLVYYIPMVTTLAIMCIETVYKKLGDNGSDVYIALSQALSFMLIYFGREEWWPIAILFATIIIVDSMLKNRNDEWNVLPLLAVIPALFINDFAEGVRNRPYASVCGCCFSCVIN